MYIQLFILLIIGLIIYFYINEEYGGVYVKSSIDNNYYYVRNLPDKQKAADLLANLKLTLIQFCHCLKKKYNNKDNVNRLIENFNPNEMHEGISDNYTSYSVNKGEKIVFCIRHRDGIHKGKLQDKNTLMYVALHELSHLASKSYHHTQEFNENFSFLMQEAIDCGYYKPIKLPTKYCGLTIYSSPLKTNHN